MRKIILVAVLALFACVQENDQSPASATAEAGPIDQAAALNELVEAYFEENLVLNPLTATFIGDNRFNDRLANSLSPEYIETSKTLERKYLAAVLEIDDNELSGQDLLTYEIFRLNRETAIASERFPGELLPLNQMFSLPNFFAVMGSGQSVQPFVTVTDYENFLSRADDLVEYMDQAIVNMRIGVERGVVQPRVVMEKVVPQLRTHIVDDVTTSVFNGPVANMPDDFSEEDQARLTAAYTDMIENRLVPAYRRVAEFIEQEYMPATRETVGWDALPDGKAWYAFRAENSTTTKMSPEEIHEIGLAEVERIHGEMLEIIDAVGFEDGFEAFLGFLRTDPRFYARTSEELLQRAAYITKTMDGKLPALFKTMPRLPYTVEAVPEDLAPKYTVGRYVPAPIGSTRPGKYWVNTYDLETRPLYNLEALSLHEAVPGHHFQISLNQELEDLPNFRRHSYISAFGEGWGLYSEWLGLEAGFYTDPYNNFGRLTYEMWRACRLVVDTGVHAKGWTREQMMEFLASRTALSLHEVETETDRYISWPGQALAYKIGELKIKELRRRAEEELGARFDVRAFHDAVLRNGSVPLPVLEQIIEGYIQERRAGGA